MVRGTVTRKPVFQVSGAREWRGGEVQLGLLADQLPYVEGDLFCVPRGSELARRLGVRHVTELDGTGFLHPMAGWRLRRRLAGAGPAILHAHSSKAIETALLARAGLRVPLVISRRNAFPIASGWKYRAADALIAISHAAADRLIAAGVDAGRITVIPDAVDARRFDGAVPDRLGLGGEAVLVLCAAAFEGEKDHETLLRAWARVEEADRDAHLLLAGEGSLQERTQAAADELKLRRVRFCGWREDLPRLVAGCDLAVLASRSEGLSTFALEAQWCGTPVVATDAGGLPEAVEHGVTGLLSSVGDPGGLSENLLRMIGDDEERRRMGDAARNRAQALFSAERVAEMTEQVYASL